MQTATILLTPLGLPPHRSHRGDVLRGADAEGLSRPPYTVTATAIFRKRVTAMRRHRPMRGLLSACVGVLLVACGLPSLTVTPSPTTVASPSASGQPPDQFASPPPAAVQEALAQARITFVPLDDAQLGIVRVTASEAEGTALADAGSGYGPDDARVVWKKVGCIFLGYYTEPMQPRLGYVPRTLAAYLVQVLADPVPDFPMIHIGVVVIDATTAERLTTYGGGDAPNGIMGATCGVSP